MDSNPISVHTTGFFRFSSGTAPVPKRVPPGGISGFASTVILQPLDLVKTRLQQDNTLKASERRSIPAIFKKIWIEEGKLGLWKGTGATLAR